MKSWQLLLYPLTALYAAITDLRNYFYDHNYRKSFAFETILINVGNITVGGTGKTPHVEYLIRLLKDHYQLATLSRGYGRQTKGFILANPQSTAEQIGDEPLQFYHKFAPQIQVAVGEERALAIPSILLEYPDTQIIILDDAYQHRPVRPNFNILLTDYHRLFYQDYPFPSGLLRESRKGAKRADAVIVTKCPHNLPTDEQSQMETNIRRYTQAETPIFFTSIRYASPDLAAFTQAQAETPNFQSSVLLFSGIAQSQPLENYVAEAFNLAEVMRFPDHHRYTPKDIQAIKDKFKTLPSPSKILLTTEKDYMRLRAPDLQLLLQDTPLFFLPIEVYFLNKGESFNQIIRNLIEHALKALNA